jgi:hypothetical protein
LLNYINYISDIENMYMEQKVDTNQNSEWGPDDDMENGLNVTIEIFIFILNLKIA